MISQDLLDQPLFQVLERMAENDTDCFDATMGHGYLTAQVISPCPDSPAEICATLFPNLDETGVSEQAMITKIQDVLSQIDLRFNSDDEQGLIPVFRDGGENGSDDDLFISTLADWSTGFLEAHMPQEKAWLDGNEQEVAELLLPCALLSGLFAEEEDFKELSNNLELLVSMAEELPGALTELYLLMRKQLADS